MDDVQSLTTDSSFKIGPISFQGPSILAPMDGYSDSPFRQISRELGSAGSITEFINTIEVVSNNSKYARRCQFTSTERPIGIQLFDNDADRIISGALKLQDLFKPDWIDINMGCSVAHVANRGAGVGLLKNPKLIGKIMDGLVKQLDIPVTAKIRLGWDSESVNYLEIGRILEDSGTAMVAIHARTGEQLFNGNVDWDAIALLKQSLKIPVIGNGDIRTVSDISRMKNYTKCDAVMIGRGAIANPWIFAGYDLPELPVALFTKTIYEHFELMKAFYGPERGCVVYRKFAKKYLTHLGIDKLKIRNLLTTVDPDAFSRKLVVLTESASCVIEDGAI